MIGFLVEAVVISLSGVMAPGPMTAVAVGKGSNSPHAGALVAIGHGIVEFPLMIALLYGFGALLERDAVRAGVSLLGGLFLLVMGAGMFRSINRGNLASEGSFRSPVVAGVVLSVGNPYFLVWWATVGAALITRSIDFGLLGFSIFAVAHWGCDFAWCYFLSALSFKGGQFFGRVFQKGVFAVCGVLLIVFGVKFIVDSVGVIFP
jgi:threonine/homoserine/homoserine lactone efflux protein